MTHKDENIKIILIIVESDSGLASLVPMILSFSALERSNTMNPNIGISSITTCIENMTILTKSSLKFWDFEMIKHNNSIVTAKYSALFKTDLSHHIA